jgi:regulator of protease activity HflC (stomatin/prohibitin superfamily)
MPAILSVIGTVFLLILIAGSMYGCPQYNVYSARLDGEAQLARADQSREVQVRDAKAKLDSAKYHALAEVERAKGVAEANKIIGSSLHDNEGYLRYLYINKLGENAAHGQIIYIPTEAGLPILESGRINAKSR